MRRTAMMCAAFLMAFPALAQQPEGFERLATRVGLVVLGNAQEFEVLTSAGSEKNRYFCAAGEFAHIRLGARSSDQLLVASRMVGSRYQSHRRAYVFRLAGEGRQDRFSLHMGGPRVGQVLSVGHARGMCDAVLRRAGRQKRDDD
ncbi:MAG: hypothetical protein ACK5JR_08615 [Tropicimonas sp.]|uniref:hypothetical protein n=1 Tax=Tropicimonas sp. TaxID=2067044 RepID=UPI003A839AC4